MDCKQSHRHTGGLTHRQTDEHKKVKILKKTTLSVVNAGPPDTEYLYYPLHVEGVTLNCSLLPAHIKQTIIIITIIRISTKIAFICPFSIIL